jgi:Ribbon-helix-helix protein, copG family
MPVVTIKMPKAMHTRLESEAARRRTTKSAILRDAFARTASPDLSRPRSLADRAKHLIGTIDGPGNLSARSKKMVGYGRFRRP